MFSFKNKGLLSQLTNIKRYHTRLAAGKKTKFVLPDEKETKSPMELLDLTYEAVLYHPSKEVYNQLDQRLRANPMFRAILEDSFLQPASYVKPSTLPTQDELSAGFTVECFIKVEMIV